jgi:hypothetical protein
MKKNKNSVYIRYEFSNKSGTPEGGDIFEFSSMNEVQDMTSEILKVAQIDNVAINLTIGQSKSFFGFLKNVGMKQEEIEKEIVDRDLVQTTEKKERKRKKLPAKAKAKAKKKAS